MYALASLGLRLFCVAGTLTHSLTLTHTHSLTHLFCVAGVRQCALPRGRNVRPGVPWAPPLLRGRRGTMCTAKGSDVRPGVPWAPPLLRGRCGAMCIAKGSDVASLGLRLFCVAGVGQCALPRGWMYALAYFGLRLFCVAGVGQCALPRGRMYALACLGLRFFCVADVGQCAFCVAGVGQCVLPRGRMYALASLGLRLFCVAGLADWCLDSDLSAQVMMLVYGTWTAHSPTHSLSLPLTPSHSLSPHSHSLSLTLTHSHSLTHSSIHSLTHSLIHTPSLLYFLFPSCFSMLSPSLKKLVTCGVIRSFNLHWGKSFDFMAPADSVRRLEMQNFGLPQFCASFGVFSCGVCRSRAESVHLLKPYLQCGKG